MKNKNKISTTFLLVPMTFLTLAFIEITLAAMMAMGAAAAAVPAKENSTEVIVLKRIEDDREEKKLCDLETVICPGEKMPPIEPIKKESIILPLEPQDVQNLILYYSKQYGIDPALPLRIAFCESGYQNIPNRQSHTKGAGIFMFIPSTWRAHCQGDRYDIEKNVECGVRLIANGESSRWGTPTSDWGSYKCWK